MTAHSNQEDPGASAPLLERERVPWLGVLPVTTTFAFYLLPGSARQLTLVQFAPQFIAYLSLLCWAHLNGRVSARLGLESFKLREGLRWGTTLGAVLGLVNVWIILWLVPRLGRDITFLRETPHGQLPIWIMLPWFIMAIAVFVEVNFRGFQLGRLLLSTRAMCPTQAQELGGLLALLLSAMAFAFDPFMVATFKHLHWIALWDGLIWGVIWIRHRNLYTTIVAHAVEVMILYSVVRYWLDV